MAPVGFESRDRATLEEEDVGPRPGDLEIHRAAGLALERDGERGRGARLRHVDRGHAGEPSRHRDLAHAARRGDGHAALVGDRGRADREGVAAETIASGVTVPATTLSPRPHAALTTTSSRAPVTGFALKTTPAASAGMSCWTRTAARSGVAGRPAWRR